MNKFARPNAIHSLNGILPFWKPINIDETDLFQKTYSLLSRDVGVTFKFAKRWLTKSVARLPNYSSGVSILATGNGCRVADGDVLHHRLPATYRALINFNSEKLASVDKFNDFLSRFAGRLLLDQLKICSFDESTGIEKPFLDPEKFKTSFELTIDKAQCVQLQNSQATLHIECKPTFLLPHLFGNMETELNSVVVLKELCRIKLGPFHQSDCLNLEGCTYELFKQKLKQIKVMHGNLIEDFYTNEEWRNLGS